MSNIYINEPATSGKVIVHTSAGPVDIELWSKECPLACRNFVQLCLEGYYDGTQFHRVVKEFIVQGGDPTGTGAGGDSIYGSPFKDEFHQRLRFTRRGLVAMANAGKNDNGSQFFFTLDRTPDLDKKHTIFGKVAGPTVFNMIKLSEVECDVNERPRHPHSVKRTEVVDNPFTDIEPRKQPKKRHSDDKKKATSRATKNFNLLSFGDEAEEDEEATVVVNKSLHASKGKSAHDLLQDEKLSAAPAVTRDELGGDANDEGEEEASSSRVHSVRDRLKARAKKTGGGSKTAAANDDDADFEALLKEASDDTKRSHMEALRAEAKRLAKDIRRRDDSDEGEAEEAPVTPIVAQFRADRAKFLQMTAQNKGIDNREQNTLALLHKFRSRIQGAKKSVLRSGGKQKELEPKALEKVEQIKQDLEAEDFEDDSCCGLKVCRNPTLTKRGNFKAQATKRASVSNCRAWVKMATKLEGGEELKSAKDANTKKDEDWYDISDPRHPFNKRRRGETADGEEPQVKLPPLKKFK